MHWRKVFDPFGFIADSLKESDGLFACEKSYGEAGGLRSILDQNL